jgi:protein-S-isoprenylcysteine O-methyltransferase Ste14
MSVELAGSSLLLPISISLVAICSFAWALRGHFVTEGRMPKGMRLLSAISLLSYLIYVGLLFWRGYEVTIATIAGMIGFMLSLILFWWTVSKTRSRRLRLAYTDADPDTINTEGPYALVRHPFYLSYIIFWICTGLVAGSWQWVPALALTLWYVRVAQDEERRFRSTRLSDAYDRYRQRTGMLLPRLRRRHGSFSRSAEQPNDLLERAHSPRSSPPPSASQLSE